MNGCLVYPAFTAIFLRQDPCRSFDTEYRLFLNALELLIWHLLPGSATRSVYHLHGPVRSFMTVNVIETYVFSHRDLNLFKRITCCIPGIKPVHM